MRGLSFNLLGIIGLPWSAGYHTCKAYWHDILTQNRYCSGSVTWKMKTASETQGQNQG